ncbi:MAG TPA: hypothetical protein VGN72_19485 [Tepidisphaeraceae bacterium]|jgi:hypothetical protein|nr:hypothetical protein [Tepidisphaeraceae bacterium]
MLDFQRNHTAVVEGAAPSRHRGRVAVAAVVALLSAAPHAKAADPSLVDAVVNYADTMLEHGRDRYGEKHTPFFITNLSRTAEVPEYLHEGNISPESKKLYGWTDRYYDRAWGGANLFHHMQLHELLASLSESTGNPKYRDASDAAIKFLFTDTQNPETNLLLWGEHLNWDVRRDTFYYTKDKSKPHADAHEPFEPVAPEFWDRAHALAPENFRKYALGVWEHQIYDQKTGVFSRHANWSTHRPQTDGAFPRVGGWMILLWTKAYALNPDDAQLREQMLHAIDVMTVFFERQMVESTGALRAGLNKDGQAVGMAQMAWLANNLMFAVDTELAAQWLPETQAKRLRDLNRRIDEWALTKLNHNFDGEQADRPRGYLIKVYSEDLLADGTHRPGDPTMPARPREWPYTNEWLTGYGSSLASETGRLLLERYQTTRDPRLLALALQSADVYLTSEPVTENLLATAMANAIEFMIEVHGVTKEQKYLDRAVHFAGKARELLLTGDSPLPMASSSHNHYEALAGSDELPLAMWKLAQVLNEKPQ